MKDIFCPFKEKGNRDKGIIPYSIFINIDRPGFIWKLQLRIGIILINFVYNFRVKSFKNECFLKRILTQNDH